MLSERSVYPCNMSLINCFHTEKNDSLFLGVRGDSISQQSAWEWYAFSLRLTSSFRRIFKRFANIKVYLRKSGCARSKIKVCRVGGVSWRTGTGAFPGAPAQERFLEPQHRSDSWSPSTGAFPGAPAQERFLAPQRRRVSWRPSTGAFPGAPAQERFLMRLRRSVSWRP